MADITDIKSIMYTEKSLALQEDGVIVVQTTPRMTKNGLKEVRRVSVKKGLAKSNTERYNYISPYVKEKVLCETSRRCKNRKLSGIRIEDGN